MGVLILGIEPPKDCYHCWIPCSVDFTDRGRSSRPKNCPCLEVIESNVKDYIPTEKCKYFLDGDAYGQNLKACMAAKGMPTCQCGGDRTKCEL